MFFINLSCDKNEHTRKKDGDNIKGIAKLRTILKVPLILLVSELYWREGHNSSKRYLLIWCFDNNGEDTV